MVDAVCPQRSCLNRLPSRATPYLAPAAGTIISATPLARASGVRLGEREIRNVELALTAGIQANPDALSGTPEATVTCK